MGASCTAHSGREMILECRNNVSRLQQTLVRPIPTFSSTQPTPVNSVLINAPGSASNNEFGNTLRPTCQFVQALSSYNNAGNSTQKMIFGSIFWAVCKACDISFLGKWEAKQDKPSPAP